MPDNAAVLDLHGRTTVEDVTTALAAHLGQAVAPGVEGLITAPQTVVQPLLVLDGLDAVEGVDLKPLVDAVVVLAVGAPSGTVDEVVFRVDPLPPEHARQLVENERLRQGLSLDADVAQDDDRTGHRRSIPPVPSMRAAWTQRRTG